MQPPSQQLRRQLWRELLRQLDEGQHFQRPCGPHNHPRRCAKRHAQSRTARAATQKLAALFVRKAARAAEHLRRNDARRGRRWPRELATWIETDQAMVRLKISSCLSGTSVNISVFVRRM